MGGVERRYIDFLILLITTSLVQERKNMYKMKEAGMLLPKKSYYKWSREK